MGEYLRVNIVAFFQLRFFRINLLKNVLANKNHFPIATRCFHLEKAFKIASATSPAKERTSKRTHGLNKLHVSFENWKKWSSSLLNKNGSLLFLNTSLALSTHKLYKNFPITVSEFCLIFHGAS